MDIPAIVTYLQGKVPNLLAIYAFGSQITGYSRSDSDLDIAVLVEGYADPVQLFDWAGELADLVGCPVDLVDLRAASTVMQYQIITHGQPWWQKDSQARLYEVAILSDKLALDEARANLLHDIAGRGTVHGG